MFVRCEKVFNASAAPAQWKVIVLQNLLFRESLCLYDAKQVWHLYLCVYACSVCVCVFD